MRKERKNVWETKAQNVPSLMKTKRKTNKKTTIKEAQRIQVWRTHTHTHRTRSMIQLKTSDKKILKAVRGGKKDTLLHIEDQRHQWQQIFRQEYKSKYKWIWKKKQSIKNSIPGKNIFLNNEGKIKTFSNKSWQHLQQAHTTRNVYI